MNGHARNWSLAWLALRSLLWTILLPGVFAGYVPWRFFGLGRTQFDLTSPTQLLGFVCIGLGVALLAACIFEFARSGQGTLSPVDPPRHLVVRGLYRYLRNPMYLSVTMIIFWWRIPWRSPFIGRSGSRARISSSWYTKSPPCDCALESRTMSTLSGSDVGFRGSVAITSDGDW